MRIGGASPRLDVTTEAVWDLSRQQRPRTRHRQGVNRFAALMLLLVQVGTSFRYVRAADRRRSSETLGKSITSVSPQQAAATVPVSRATAGEGRRCSNIRRATATARSRTTARTAPGCRRRAITIVRRITERKRAERASRES